MNIVIKLKYYKFTVNFYQKIVSICDSEPQNKNLSKMKSRFRTIHGLGEEKQFEKGGLKTPGEPQIRQQSTERMICSVF